MGDLTTDFNKWEFKCSHCGIFHMNAAFIEKLQAFRTYIDVIMHVTCGYRCQIHNDSLKGASRKSQHLDGNAVDCWTQAMSAIELALMAIDFGFRGVICYPDKGIVHIDERPGDVWHVLPPKTKVKRKEEDKMAKDEGKKAMKKSKTTWCAAFTGVFAIARVIFPEWAVLIECAMAATGTGAVIAMRQGIEKAK